jgi:hypothetical protein
VRQRVSFSPGGPTAQWAAREMRSEEFRWAPSVCLNRYIVLGDFISRVEERSGEGPYVDRSLAAEALSEKAFLFGELLKRISEISRERLKVFPLEG